MDDLAPAFRSWAPELRLEAELSNSEAVMRNRACFGMWSCVGLALLWSPARACLLLLSHEKDYKISTTTRLVLLDVRVRHSAGGFVSGLTKDNFHVCEDGKPQVITHFANCRHPSHHRPLGRRERQYAHQKTGGDDRCHGLLSASNPQDEMFVLNFNEKVSHGLPDTYCSATTMMPCARSLEWYTPEGRTALYDAIVAG